jgi:hypothetical protein
MRFAAAPGASHTPCWYRRAVKAEISLALTLALGAAACGKTEPQQGAPAPAPPTASAATKPPEPAKKAAPCDAYDLWFGDELQGDTPEARRAAFVKVLRPWTSECRLTGIKSVCERAGCDEVVSDPIIESAAADPERKQLWKYRLDRNTEAVKIGRAQLEAVKKIVAYANSIRSAPRTSKYVPPGSSLDKIADGIANGNPCLTRMRADFDRIKVAMAELDAAASKATAGLIGLHMALAAAQSCVDCTDDRTTCDAMAEPVKNATDLVADIEKLMASDRAAVR